MKILHVLSQFEITGAEAYVASLVGELSKRGHRSFVVSDTLCLPMDATFISRPIGRRSYLQRVKNIFWLRRLIREKEIQLVHAHSRAASWVAFASARLSNTAYVSTIHGRQHVHASSRFWKIYGDHLIAVCDSIKQHLSQDLRIPQEKISVIPNGLHSQWWDPQQVKLSKEKLFGVPSEIKVVAFIGRLSGLKGDVVRFLLSRDALPLHAPQKCVLALVGGTEIPRDIAELIESANRRAGTKFVIWHSSREDVAPMIHTSDVVIGSGRVALEALALRKPVIAFGESEYLGMISSKNFHSAFGSNFGDSGETRDTKKGLFPNVDAARVSGDISDVLMEGGNEEDADTLSNLVYKSCNASAVSERVQKVYERAYLQENSPRYIPVLMYHRVVDEAPQGLSHGIWITRDEFESQMKSLRRRRIMPITFKDYDAFARGDSHLPARPIILTFDDGYEDNYTLAFPILQKHGFSAVIYAVTAMGQRTNFWDVDQPTASLMNCAQIKEMSNYGIEFGSHTTSHSDLTTTRRNTLQEEVCQSKKTLEDIIGTEVMSFAYPYGRLNAEAKEAVSEAEYKFAAGADNGPIVFYEDLYSIRRTQIFPWTSSFGFWKKSQSWYWRYRDLMHRP